ncbi:MAG: hypothetical protein ACFNS5_10430, partial [Prevotella melaninogenica]
TSLKIKLSEATQDLDEVVVVGYGTQKNLVHLLLCLSIILSFLASNSLTCLLAFPHPEKTLHSLKQITLKSIQKPSSRATLQPTENQIVIKP